MANTLNQPTAGPVVAAGPVLAASNQSYTDWPSILAGAVFAMALSFVLITFGSAIGLSFASPMDGEGASLRWITIAGGIWMIWVSVSSFAAGGYLAGRLRRRADDANEDEVEARDGAHGVIMWAVGVVFGSVLAVSGITGLAGSVGSGAIAALEAADVQISADIDYTSSTLLRDEAASVVGTTVVNTAGSNADARAEIGTILRRGIVAGEVPESDRAYLASVVARNTDLSPDAARARVDTVIADSLAAREAALKAAEQARIASIIAAFVLAATLLVSAAAAYFAATVGGGHRDRNLGFRIYGR
ncbi:MAG: hypothetical protein O3A96_11200 [Proteobacteria bacterium]|nr:hypothetical protein [Pseudomonadota bacterium]